MPATQRMPHDAAQMRLNNYRRCSNNPQGQTTQPARVRQPVGATRSAAPQSSQRDMIAAQLARLESINNVLSTSAALAPSTSTEEPASTEVPEPVQVASPMVDSAAAAPAGDDSANDVELQDMRARLAAISNRYDAIEQLIGRLVSSSKAGVRKSSPAFEGAPDSIAREEMDEALVAFFAATKLDASAVEHPAFLRLLETRRRHHDQNYRPPRTTALRDKLLTQTELECERVSCS